MARPRVSSAPKASCRRPVWPSAAISAAAGDALADQPDRREGQRHGGQRDQAQRRAPAPGPRPRRTGPATQPAYSTLVRWSPSTTASVRLPVCASVGMSRRLLMTSSAQASRPDRRRRGHRQPGQRPSLDVGRAGHGDQAEEHEHRDLAERRGTRRAGCRRCRTRPPPRRPRRPAAATTTSPRPAPGPPRPATAKQASAAASTCRGRARPEATSRTGPTRTSSVPRIPSL